MTGLKPQAVLWDMDGTLVDTEPYWMAAEGPLVESFGGTWTHEDALQLIGLSLPESGRRLQAAGVALSVDEIIVQLTDTVVRSMQQHGLPFRPGARELLWSLREAEIPTALVTMSMHRMAEDVVSLIDFPAFDVILGGDDVARGKPHPDPYLEGAAALGIDVTKTVAIEDSPNGLRSAVASGAVALGVTNILSLDGLGAAEVWSTLADVDAASLAALYERHRA